MTTGTESDGLRGLSGSERDRTTLANGRFDLRRLAALVGLSKRAMQTELNIGGGQWSSYWRDGVTARVADRCAVRFGFHPAEVWPEWLDEGVALAKKPCATCGEPFLPHRRTVLYCSQRCRRLIQQRRYRARPDVAERNREKRRAAYVESAEYERARQRRYYAENREKVLARRRRAVESHPCSSMESGTTLHVENECCPAVGTDRAAFPNRLDERQSEMADSTRDAQVAH